VKGWISFLIHSIAEGVITMFKRLIFTAVVALLVLCHIAQAENTLWNYSKSADGTQCTNVRIHTEDSRIFAGYTTAPGRTHYSAYWIEFDNSGNTVCMQTCLLQNVRYNSYVELRSDGSGIIAKTTTNPDTGDTEAILMMKSASGDTLCIRGSGEEVKMQEFFNQAPARRVNIGSLMMNVFDLFRFDVLLKNLDK
jgi:hypothetical protein